MKFILKSVSALALMSGMANAQSWNVDVFAGAALENELDWDGTSYSVNAGSVFGIGISKSDVFVPNLEIGFELSRTSAEYTGFEPNSITGLAGFITAEYSFVTADKFQAYAGIGLGAVNVTYFNFFGYTNSEVVVGGQVVLGARYAVSSNMALFAEARYIDTFTDPLVAYDPVTDVVEFNATSIVIGVRNSF